jgi:hypothetical protein
MRLPAPALILSAALALGATGCTIVTSTPRTAKACERDAPPPPACPATRDVPRGAPVDAEPCP